MACPPVPGLSSPHLKDNHLSSHPQNSTWTDERREERGEEEKRERRGEEREERRGEERAEREERKVRKRGRVKPEKEKRESSSEQVPREMANHVEFIIAPEEISLEHREIDNVACFSVELERVDDGASSKRQDFEVE